MIGSCLGDQYLTLAMSGCEEHSGVSGIRTHFYLSLMGMFCLLATADAAMIHHWLMNSSFEKQPGLATSFQLLKLFLFELELDCDH